MTVESLRLVRNILLRAVVVGVAFAVFFALATLAGWEMWMPLVTKWFHTDESTVGPIVLKFFVDIRFFLVFILLTPALALHWTMKREIARAK